MFNKHVNPINITIVYFFNFDLCLKSCEHGFKTYTSLISCSPTLQQYQVRFQLLFYLQYSYFRPLVQTEFSSNHFSKSSVLNPFSAVIVSVLKISNRQISWSPGLSPQGLYFILQSHKFHCLQLQSRPHCTVC